MHLTTARHSLRALQRRNAPWHTLSAATNRALSTAPRAARPVLPEPQDLLVRGGQYNLKYIDLQPPKSSGATNKTTTTPTFVFIHGSPGTYQDYKYIIPLLQDHARIVAINLPANGDSQVVDKAHNYYEKISAITLARAAQDAVAQLCGKDESVFVVGHSFGGHATINVTALNELETDPTRKVNVKGLALLAPAGLRPHRALQMFNIGWLWQLLQSDFRVIEAAGQALTRALYTKVWRFPSKESTEYYVAGLVRCASTDFTVINDHAARIAHLPSFIAWARDDVFIQEEIFMELSEACQLGPRFAFEKGGHNIQKTKAKFLAKQLLQWTQCVIQDGASHETSRNVVVHP